MQRSRLKRVPFFAGMSEHDFDLLVRQTKEIHLPPGTVLVEEGDPGDDFFVIEQGAATVTRDGRHITEMEAGDFFGERALLETERRTATVTAISPMTVIVMSREAFLELDRSNPEVHATVAEAIAARQR